MRAGLILAASLLVAACSTAPRNLDLAAFSPTHGAAYAASFLVVNEPGQQPRRSATVVSRDVSELYEPRFSFVIADDMNAYLGTRLTGANGRSIRATIKTAEVVVEVDGGDLMGLPGALRSTLRSRPFIATASILFEVEESGRVVNSYLLTHSARANGTTTTDESRAAGTAAAIEQWRTEAFAKIDAEFLARYL